MDRTSRGGMSSWGKSFEMAPLSSYPSSDAGSHASDYYDPGFSGARSSTARSGTAYSMFGVSTAAPLFSPPPCAASGRVEKMGDRDSSSSADDSDGDGDDSTPAHEVPSPPHSARFSANLSDHAFSFHMLRSTVVMQPVQAVVQRSPSFRPLYPDATPLVSPVQASRPVALAEMNPPPMPTPPARQKTAARALGNVARVPARPAPLMHTVVSKPPSHATAMQPKAEARQLLGDAKDVDTYDDSIAQVAKHFRDHTQQPLPSYKNESVLRGLQDLVRVYVPSSSQSTSNVSEKARVVTDLSPCEAGQRTSTATGSTTATTTPTPAPPTREAAAPSPVAARSENELTPAKTPREYRRIPPPICSRPNGEDSASRSSSNQQSPLLPRKKLALSREAAMAGSPVSQDMRASDPSSPSAAGSGETSFAFDDICLDASVHSLHIPVPGGKTNRMRRAEREAAKKATGSSTTASVTAVREGQGKQKDSRESSAMLMLSHRPKRRPSVREEVAVVTVAEAPPPRPSGHRHRRSVVVASAFPAKPDAEAVEKAKHDTGTRKPSPTGPAERKGAALPPPPLAVFTAVTPLESSNMSSPWGRSGTTGTSTPQSRSANRATRLDSSPSANSGALSFLGSSQQLAAPHLSRRHPLPKLSVRRLAKPSDSQCDPNESVSLWTPHHVAAPRVKEMSSSSVRLAQPFTALSPDTERSTNTMKEDSRTATTHSTANGLSHMSASVMETVAPASLAVFAESPIIQVGTTTVAAARLPALKGGASVPTTAAELGNLHHTGRARRARSIHAGQDAARTAAVSVDVFDAMTAVPEVCQPLGLPHFRREEPHGSGDRGAPQGDSSVLSHLQSSGPFSPSRRSVSELAKQFESSTPYSPSDIVPSPLRTRALPLQKSSPMTHVGKAGQKPQPQLQRY